MAQMFFKLFYFYRTHIVVIKGPGGIEPNDDNSQEAGGTAAIMNLLKVFVSFQQGFIVKLMLL